MSPFLCRNTVYLRFEEFELLFPGSKFQVGLHDNTLLHVQFFIKHTHLIIPLNELQAQVIALLNSLLITSPELKNNTFMTDRNIPPTKQPFQKKAEAIQCYMVATYVSMYLIQLLFCGFNLMSQLEDRLPHGVQLPLHIVLLNPHFCPLLPEQVSLWCEVGVGDSIHLEFPASGKGNLCLGNGYN